MEIFNIYEKGVENDRYFSGYKSVVRKIISILYFSIIILLNRKQKHISGKINFVNGNRQLLIFNGDVATFVYHGRCLNNISSIQNKRTVVSTFSRMQRLKICFQLIKIYIKNKKSIKNIDLWIEYFFILKMIEDNNIDTVLCAGHYDRYTTWFSGLSAKMGFNLEITQHGLLDNTTTPNKIYCTKVYAFDENEINKFSNYVVGNDHCQYIVKGFRSKINFQEYEKNNKVVVGIVSQDNFEFNNELINKIMKLSKNITIIVMLHPNEKSHKYKKFNSVKNVIVEKKKKYINLDFLIVINSTLLYDYIANDYSGRVICIYKDVFPYCVKNENIIKVHSIEEAVKSIVNSI